MCSNFSPTNDLTGVQRPLSGGMVIGRTCGIGNAAHKTTVQAGGKTLRGVWHCAVCVAALDRSRVARRLGRNADILI